MDVDEMMQGAREALTVRRVFGEPIERGEVTVIPVAKALGASGGGSGEDAKGDHGGGGGFALRVKPAGVYVVQNGQVRWVPAIDPVRTVLAIGLAAALLLGAVSRLTPGRDAKAVREAQAVTVARALAKAKAGRR
ncbi:MAG TPA: spore germination protein GerW family protein [Actinotalea sp.]|nr:spore germination protein GerW family protein [Actinotalea sp.]